MVLVIWFDYTINDIDCCLVVCFDCLCTRLLSRCWLFWWFVVFCLGWLVYCELWVVVLV